MTSAEIITIGTEILLGEIVDTNTRYIARHLRNLGVDLYRTVTIGDNVERIASVIRESLERAEIVITTGGLGPTVDDPTREAVALAAGVEVEFREELWQQVVATISRYGRTPSENQKRQAYVPRNALAIPNPVGTAPAFIVETERAAVISLPGVPKEMEYLLHESVIPYLQKRFDLRHIIKVRLVHTSGMGEGAVDEKIGDLETLANPTVGLAAHNGVVDIRIAAKSETEAEADHMIAEIERELQSRLKEIIFGVDDDTLEGVTLDAVERRGWKLACLERGLPDSMSRRLPNLVTHPGLQPGSLMDELRATLRLDPAKTAALGIACFVDDMAAELGLITPRGEKFLRLTYGGHPRNLPRWAFNNALNILRLEALSAG
ncbi:MAG: competence/damage-inducible protein A [Chloroflexi bacterium]|nr:competence/damage-inducible protein A [Chloroflexota bacterium]